MIFTSFKFLEDIFQISQRIKIAALIKFCFDVTRNKPTLIL